MSRDEGFRTADLDTGFLDDPKVRALVRATRDEGTIARCLVGYLAVVTSSWRAGELVTIEDAAPVWMTAVDDVRERLAGVGLLDSDGCIPAHAWDSWYGPADTRREALREKWREYNRKRNRGGSASGTGAEPGRSNGGTASPGPTGPIPIRSDTHPVPGATRPGIPSVGVAPDGAPPQMLGVGNVDVR